MSTLSFPDARTPTSAHLDERETLIVVLDLYQQTVLINRGG